jgi:hypothetical protein
MATPTDAPTQEPPPPIASESKALASILRRWLKKNHAGTPTSQAQETEKSRDTSPVPGLIRRVSRKVVPGLPRTKTFKRQQSEGRDRLEPTRPTPAERRAVSVDRRLRSPLQRHISNTSQQLPRASAPDFLDETQSEGPQTVVQQPLSLPQSPIDEKNVLDFGNVGEYDVGGNINPEGQQDESEILPSYSQAAPSTAGGRTITTEQFDAIIGDELERTWILNLSMHFRDKTKREKFFVTYRENDHLWRRVTISLDYRNAPDNSLEKDLDHTHYQREKSAKIYEAIRDSLQDIQFYDTVTNLKLQTTDERLHVHVMEDVNVSYAPHKFNCTVHSSWKPIGDHPLSYSPRPPARKVSTS